ncbi:beta-glucosidase [Mucilaginibacter dorajii]|uniref:Beta-glucosidase n=1 Tax=Mucilaginibacter dorajii TaxID=692994 RepID=A0ABP7QZQ5_9SPHI|nr:glycoside hydrolase family 3 C-terminal domain-containing protein [Mucilaginibacter dorajii]MCS3732328.1 beta-glucosidase [Mucilaginibacter dorajii]
MKYLPLCFFLFLSNLLSAQVRDASKLPQLGKAPLEKVIDAMTLEEKARLVTGLGFNSTFNHEPVAGRTEVKVIGAAGATFGIPRLNIPTTILADGPAGVRIDPIRYKDSSKTYYATAFPVATLLASSWDTALVRKVGVAFGNEVREYGIDIILAPALNIHRNPLGGRNFEYYSEDPVVAGRMAAAMIKGIQSNGVGTSIKHFAANNQEVNRNNINAILSERALREIYLRGFEIAIQDAHPWTVMSSYNKINGTYTSESHDLLTTILRNEWHYQGYVMTDWFGGKDPIAQMNAGNDLLMPGTPRQVTAITDAVNNGSLKMAILDKNVKNILSIILKTPAFKHYNFSNTPDLKMHALISRQAAEESMVLLKNDTQTLPLKSGTSVALFGSNSYSLIAGGTGSGAVNKPYIVSIEKGLRDAGFIMNKTLSDLYTKHMADYQVNHPVSKNVLAQIKPIDEIGLTDDAIQDLAAREDIAAITIGRNAGEGRDRKLDEDFKLQDVEMDLLKRVSSAFHAKGKKVVVVLNIDNVIETTSWQRYTDAILLAWQPGMEGGHAIANIVSGQVNPSGKLATTFPLTYNDEPSSKNFPGTPVEKPLNVTYEEGIYVGYRYFDTFNVKTAYEFGYGLSYTSFRYGAVKLSSSTFQHRITVRLPITNTGKVAGKEIVQMYISAPVNQLDKPKQELKGFAKTRLLQPGETQIISFTIDAGQLCSFNSNSSSWIADAGRYQVKIGASSIDHRQVAAFTLPRDITVTRTAKVLAPQISISEIKNNNTH